MTETRIAQPRVEGLTLEPIVVVGKPATVPRARASSAGAQCGSPARSVADAFAEQRPRALAARVGPTGVWRSASIADGTSEALPALQRLFRFPMTAGCGCISTWPMPGAELADAAAPIPQLARELLLSHDNFQQLHTIDNCVYGVFSDLVRAIDAVTEETGFLRFA